MASSGDFPLPESFKQSVISIEKMGFEGQRKRVIELLLEGHDVEDVIDKLLEERKGELEKGKARAREGLLEILDSKLGEEVLEKMAELSLRDHQNNTTLSNFVALTMHENNVEIAYQYLKEDDE